MPLYYKSGSSWKEFAPNPYPIGTIVPNADDDISPAGLVGGTWSKYTTSTLPTIPNYSPINAYNVSLKYISSTQIQCTLSIQGYFDWSPSGNYSYELVGGCPLPYSPSAQLTTLKSFENDPKAPVYIDENGIMTAVIPGTLLGGSEYRIALASQTVTFTYTPKDIVSSPWDGLYVYKRTA